MGGWGDDDDHAEEEDVDEDDGGSGVGFGVGRGPGGGRGGGTRKNGMTHDQSSFFSSGDPSITSSRLLRLGDKRKTTTTGEEDGKSEEKEDRMGGGVGSHSIARQRRSLPSPPRDVMPPSTYASSLIRCFDCHARTTISAPPVPRCDYDVDCFEDERSQRRDQPHQQAYAPSGHYLRGTIRDAYIDGAVKYLYPAGYQSMRP